MSIRAHARRSAVRSLLALAAPSMFVALSAGCSDATSESTDGANEALYGEGSVATPWPGGSVPVCFSDTTSNAYLRGLIPQILARTWSAAANVTFAGFGACQPSGNQVTIDFVPSSDPRSRGNTDQLGSAARNVILISDDSLPNEQHFVYEVIHEMGHVLGFAHEQQRPDNWAGGVAYQCPPTPNDYGNYAPQYGGLNLTTQYDANSIMNYCNPAGYATVLSAGDASGVRKVYGLPQYGPSILSVSNNSGPNTGGTTITITGVGFDTNGGTSFLVGGYTAPDVHCTSSSQCTAKTPAYQLLKSAQVVDVQAVVANVTSMPVLEDQFTYTAGPDCTAESPLCTGIGFGMPDLTIDCTGTESFYFSPGPNQSLAGSGNRFTTGMMDFGASIAACDPSTGSCTGFSLYEENESYCGPVPPPPPPPPSCDGVPKPKKACSATWHCCGSDGWSCGVCP